MPSIDDLMKRMRVLAKSKPTREVLANGKVEVMTTTQAYRFNELQELGYADDLPPDLPKKAVYELHEAAVRLQVDTPELLELAAAGKIRCYISASGLAGTWDPAAGTPDVAGSPPGFLALPAAACAEIHEFGSANVTELLHLRPDGAACTYRLATTQWVDAQRLLMLHPLPERR